LENRAFLEEERKGKKRGPYRTSQTKSKRWDTVDIDPTVFEEVIDVDGREYLVLLTGGRIPIEYKDLYMYVVTGKVRGWRRVTPPPYSFSLTCLHRLVDLLLPPLKSSREVPPRPHPPTQHTQSKFGRDLPLTSRERFE